VKMSDHSDEEKAETPVQELSRGSSSIELKELESKDAEIDRLKGKVEHQRNLLIKAKKSLNVQKSDFVEKNKELEEAHKHIEDLETLIEQYVKEEKGSLDVEKVEAVKAKVVVNSTPWILVRVDGTFEWVLEESLPVEDKENSAEPESKPIPAINGHAIPLSINYDEEIGRMQKEEADYDQQLQNIVTQYEARIKRMQESMDSLEKSYGGAQEEYRHLVSHFEKSTKLKESEFSSLIDASVKVAEHGRTISALDITREAERDKFVTDLQATITNLLQTPCFNTDDHSSAIKEHCLLLHKVFRESIKILFSHIDQMSSQESAWKSTCDSLINQKDQEKNRQTDETQRYHIRIEDLERQVLKLRAEHYDTVRRKDDDVEKLTRELKGLNIPYLKNVIYKYLTEPDNTVKVKLIPVISTILRYDEEENNAINECSGRRGFLGLF